MGIKLKAPIEYMGVLRKLRGHNIYAKDWVLRIERKTNRHPETNGGAWGWYELLPLGIEVGYWDTSRDDLKDVDINKWNSEAKELSK